MIGHTEAGEIVARISEITLENFQGVSSKQSVGLGNFSLIFGENSAGKSSIARALLLIAQSLSESVHVKGDARNRFFVFSGQLIDLAGFKNVVHKHDDQRRISIGLKVEIDKNERLVLPPVTRQSISRPIDDFVPIELVAIGFEASESSHGLESFQVSFEFRVQQAVERLTLSFESDQKTALRLTEVFDTSVEATKAFLGVANEPDFSLNQLYELEFYWIASWVGIRGARLLSRDPASRSRIAPHLDNWLRSARAHLMSLLSAPSHIPSLREIEPRVTLRSSPVRSSKIRRFTQMRDAAASRFLNRLTDGRYDVETSSYEMGESGFLGEVEVKFLRDNFLGVAVSFQDVGVGLSQVLPLLLAMDSLNSESGNNLVIVEQPELHLHPRMQAELAELVFLEAEIGGQVIAETHSEAMLLRLQRIIRKRHQMGKQFRGVTIVYASFDAESGTQYQNLELRSDLDFVIDMPSSFSDLRLGELE